MSENIPSELSVKPKKQRPEKQPILRRLRGRIDRYRELGRARRSRLEQKLEVRDRAAPPPLFELVPGTARGLLDANDFDNLERHIGYTIKHRAYFMQALTHRSYLQFAQYPQLKSNERLEFLGDSILNLVIAEYLYGEFESLPEGDLTKLRSRLVSGAALLQHAEEIELEQFLLLSTSADAALKRGSATLLADAYEAVIAAIYLDGGMTAARDFIYRHIITHARRDELMLSDKNYKSMLLEFVQSKKLSSPRYVTMKEEGPNHARTFSVDVMVGGLRHGSGIGRSKKEAEQNAARDALGLLGVLPRAARQNSTGELTGDA
ncbi:MAG TPA: ribonuclease III [Candidatus Kapabacteria bacterium]|nr:ribonuclease III [Candidatus Kapabacteria bacterium]